MNMKKLIKVIILALLMMLCFCNYSFALGETGKVTVGEGSYEYKIITETEVVLSKYIGEEKDIVVPSTVVLENGKEMKVYLIENRAFSFNQHIETVKVSEGIQGVDRYAFNGLSNLTKVTFPASIKTIPNDVVYQCPNAKYNIPDNLTRIEDNGDYQELATVTATATTRYDLVEKYFEKINNYRLENNNEAVVLDKNLSEKLLKRVVEKTVYYAIESPDGVWRDSVVYSFVVKAGNEENIIPAYQNSMLCDRENINEKYKSIGLACVEVDGYVYLIYELSTNESTQVYNIPKEDEEVTYKINIATGGNINYVHTTQGASVSVIPRNDKIIDICFDNLKEGNNDLFVDDVVEINKVYIRNKVNTVGILNLNREISLDDIKMVSSDEAVALIDEDGNIKCLAEGTATITVSIGKYYSKDYVINVEEVPAVSEELEVDTVETNGTSIPAFVIKPGIVILDFLKPINFPCLDKNFGVKVTNKNNQEKSSTSRLGTRDIVKIEKDGKEVGFYVIAIPGDVDGDGLAKIIDSFIMLKDAIQKSQDEFDGIDMKVMDHDGNGKISMVDAFKYFSDALK